MVRLDLMSRRWEGLRAITAHCEGSMAYRIHFTSQDIARTRVADAPRPLLELECAMRALQNRSRPALLDSWRRRSRALLTPEARMALSLTPNVGFSPSFHTPAEDTSVEELLDQVRATPREAVRWQLATIVEVFGQPVPSWARALPDDRELYARLSRGVEDLYATLLAPSWDRIADGFRADRAIRMRHMAAGGIERVLAEANPRWMRWKPPTLEIEMPNGVEYDLYPAGRGVVLAPSVFRTRTLVLDDSEPQPVVTYPADPGWPVRGLTLLAPPPSTRASASAVAALLGSTRSVVLNVIAERPGCSTKELAATAGIAPASASEHATVLRNAGLIRTGRHRNTVLHSVTDLGLALLNAPPQLS
jgi:hypothetical protein